MLRNWLLYLDDLIAGAQKIRRLTQAHSRDSFVADEAAFDAVLFNLQVIGEAMKRLPAEAVERLSEVHRAGPARLRDLIAHHYFAIDPDIIWEVATQHTRALLDEAKQLRDSVDVEHPDPGATGPGAAKPG